MRTETISWAVRGAGLAVGVGLVLLLVFLAGAARDVLLLVFVAILLGAALEPLVGAIRARTGIGRGLSMKPRARAHPPTALPSCVSPFIIGESSDKSAE